MKFCCTQPAWLASTPSFFIVSFTVSRNCFASADVGAAASLVAQAAEPATIPAASNRQIVFMVNVLFESVDRRRNDKRRAGRRFHSIDRRVGREFAKDESTGRDVD